MRLLPLLWAVCFVEGMCKIQGTFECMSTIQLWITPQRDFTAFFPVLHIVILGCMQLSTIITTALMHHYHWVWMHLLVSALMAVDLLIVRLCTRHFRIVRKMPLYGIDWLGALLWVALLLQVAYLFDYGEWYDWWYSPVMRRLAVTSVATLALCLWRMNTIRHPYIEPRMWSYRHLFPILILITLVEMLLATEHVLEGAFYEQTMHYDATVSVLVTRWVLVGVLVGVRLRLLVDARAAHELRASADGGHRGACGLPSGILLHRLGRHTRLATLSAGGLPRLRLRHPERDVHGLP